MLGAVVGGLLENLSLIIGMKALLVVAALLYSLAALGFRGLALTPVRRLDPPGTAAVGTRLADSSV